MLRQPPRRFWPLLASFALSALYFGCTGPDDPKLVKVPDYKAPEGPGEPPKLPGKATLPGNNAKYQEIMEKRAKLQQQQAR